MSISMSRGRLAAAVLTLGCLLAAGAPAARAATVSLYAAPAAVGAGDCSAAAAACTIDAAVTAANAANVADSVRIRLAGGTYALSAPTPTALPITFAGPSLTLEADGGTPTLDGTGTVQVLSVGATSNVTIDGLVLKSGLTTGLGGAVGNAGTLTVRNSRFTDNTAANGGAISNTSGSTLTVEDSTFSQNTTTSVGGGAIIASGTATIRRSLITGNQAPVNGGGINVQPGATVQITSSTIANNTSGGLGGGLSNLGAVTVQLSTIAGNSASAGSAIATGNSNAVFAADIIATQAAGDACNPANSAIVDGGYNLDVDGTCISATAPATGSRNGTTAYGTSTSGAILTAYLAGGLADNGGPTQTVALLNTASPATDLANPALAAIPPSFTLPGSAGGLAAACAAGDQRGIVPVAGASCAIGAYLLQETATAVTLPDKAVQNTPVTLTATITPAADGGTVSFSDGAGNPATAGCAARPVVRGTATCTVTYPTVGDYNVAASYTGDGEKNNYRPSAGTAQKLTVSPPPPDQTSPTSSMRRVTSVKQPITLRGSATDTGGIRRVRVSIARNVGDLCRFLQANRTFSAPRDCKRTSYIDAKGTTSWTLKLPTLPGGRYMVWSRAIDTAGNVERKDRKRNFLTFRIPRS